MTPDDLTRAFPFTVRPRHRETLESYSRRSLAANAESDALPRELQKLARDTGAKADWSGILSAKAGRDLGRLIPMEPRTPHTDCAPCAKLLEVRWACVLCSHGERVQEYPHLDDFLCERHERWTGPGTTTETQTRVSPGGVAAHRRFRKLRSRGRIDMPLLCELLDALVRDLRLDTHEVFAAAVATVAWVTRKDTMRRVFDPAQPYADTYKWMSSALAELVGAVVPATLRAIWLRLWPAHIALQTALRGYSDYRPSHEHDFALPENIASWYPHTGELQGARAYLECAGLDGRATTEAKDGEPTVAKPVVQYAHCRKGHRYLEVLTSKDCGQTPCPTCTRSHVVRGVNDLASVAPEIAADLHPTLNGELTAVDITAASSRPVWWVCDVFHPYRATPANRTLNGTECAVCLGRVILIGVNDLQTTHPDIAADLHPGSCSTKRADQLTANDAKPRAWVCGEGHEYRATVRQRVEGKSCPECDKRRNRTSGRGFAYRFPELAATWRPELNEGRDPRDYTARSKLDVIWWCEKGHPFKMRIEARTRGCGCPYCARRRILQGFNDFQTTHPELVVDWHPYLNWRRPSEVMAGSDVKYIWRCARGHLTNQSIPRRILSGGCKECPAWERAGNHEVVELAA